MKKSKKLIFKPIGSIAGIGSNAAIKNFLNNAFSEVDFVKDQDGLTAFAKYIGLINNKEVRVSFTILRRTKYTGFGVDHLLKYRTFQGIRMRISIPSNNPTRLLITKITKGSFLIKLTKWVMKYKSFKKINSIKINDFEREVWSPDELFAKGFIANSKINTILNLLTNIKANILSWGIIVIPNRADISFTFANLDDFEPELLKARLKNSVEIVEQFESIPISKKLELTKSELIAQNNPKVFLWRSLGVLFLFIIFGTALLIGSLYLLAKLIGMA